MGSESQQCSLPSSFAAIAIPRLPVRDLQDPAQFIPGCPVRKHSVNRLSLSLVGPGEIRFALSSDDLKLPPGADDALELRGQLDASISFFAA